MKTSNIARWGRGILEGAARLGLPLCILGLPFLSPAQSYFPSTNDLWDINQGSVVTATSGINYGSDERDMFGGTFAQIEPGNTVFADGMPAGFVHYTDWQTPGPVTVSSFLLFASGDGPAAQFPTQREFAQFVLKAKSSALATNYDLTLYTLVVTNHPYVFVDPASYALLVTNITPVTAQYFRAEFTQYNAGNGYDGPRIVELDGFGTNLPVVVTQPTNQTVSNGMNASFSVSATGTAPLSYQWFVNQSNIPAATNATLVLTDVQVGQSGNLYSVVITNLEGSTNSSNALLTVVPPGTCTPPPSGLVSWWAAQGNANDSFGTNNGTLVGGVTFTNGEVGEAFQFDGATGYVSIPASASLNVGSGGSYTVEGWIKPASLTADVPLMEWNNGLNQGNTSLGSHFWINQPADASGSGPGSLFANIVDTGGNWHIITSPAGILSTNSFQHVALTYNGTNGVAALYDNGTMVATQNLGSFTPRTSYGLYMATRPASGMFYAGLMDEFSVYDVALSSNQIQAIYSAGGGGKCQPDEAPTIASQPMNQATPEGATAAFSVGVTGTMPFSYQWQFNQSNILASANATATNATLVLPNVQPANLGSYSVIVTNTYGGTNSSNAVLTLLYPPTITTQPIGVLARPGCDVTFNSAASGAGTLQYQWQENGTNLSGQNGTSLALLDIQPAAFGNYTMIASNAYGAATSAVAVLALDHLPVPGATIVQRYPGAGLRFNASAILSGATDADGDQITLIGVNSNSTAGGTVNWNGYSIYYLPPAGSTNPDAFNYTLSDGHCGGTVVGTVQINVRSDTNPAARVTIVQVGDGSVQVIFDGMPDVLYQLQSADSLAPPDWSYLTTFLVDPYGSFIYLDWPATNGPTRYFRSVSP